MVDLAKFEREALYTRALEDVQKELLSLEDGAKEMAVLMRAAGINPYQDPDYQEICKARDILSEAMRKRVEADGRMARKREQLNLGDAV